MPSDPATLPDDIPGDPSARPLTGHPDVPGDAAATGPLLPADPAADLPPDTPGDPAAAGEGPPGVLDHPAGESADHPPVAATHGSADDAQAVGAEAAMPGTGSPATTAGTPAATAAVALSADPSPLTGPWPTGTADGPAGTADASPTGTPDTIPEAALRIAEAVIFASANPVSVATLAPLLPPDVEPRVLLRTLAARTAGRGVTLAQVAGGWAFRTAPDLAPAVTKVVEVPRRLPRAAMEALAIIAWHQPVTRPEIEEIRGTSLAQTTLEALLENGLIAPRGKKEAPGRPTLWGTTPRFLDQFGLSSLRDLPRREELLPEPGLPFPSPGAAPEADRAAAGVAAEPDDLNPEAGAAAPPGPELADATGAPATAPDAALPDHARIQASGVPPDAPTPEDKDAPAPRLPDAA